MAYAAGFLARVLIERGDLDGARAALADRRSRHPAPTAMGWCAAPRSSCCSPRATGRALLPTPTYHRERLRGVDNAAWAPWRSLTALALDGLGRRDAARALLEAELDKARHWGAPGSLARTLRLLGTIRKEDGHDLLHEAVDTAEARRRVSSTPRRSSRSGCVAAARKPSDAREPLGTRSRSPSHCGAEPLAEHVRTELYAAGGRPRRQALTGPDSLTPSERRIADWRPQATATATSHARSTSPRKPSRAT